MSRAVAATLPFATLVALALTAPVAQAQRAEKPRLDAGRVAIEAVGGSYAGIGGFLVGRAAGEQVGELLGVRSDVTRRRIGYTTGALVGTFATSGFVYAVGSVGDTAGDFDQTLLGAGAGLVAGYALSKLIFADGAPSPGMNTAARWAAINVIALLPAIGATIGFNSTRRLQ